ncbi:MAG TPA: TRAP transporter large permease [Terrimesophilobacter sp.]|nr:TRAP transporter large permease [Terrimesophilobacter sp.]HRP98849.1 TRAP transporter large permease [Terrimesophilobacter sp.]
MLTIAIISLIVLSAAMLIGVPIAFSMALGVGTFILFSGDWEIVPLISQTMVNSVGAFTLLAVPLFLLAGTLMTASGMTGGLAEWAMALFGRQRGGLAQASQGANFVMSGMSGSSAADTAAISALFVPQMRKQGYSPGFAAAVVAGPSVIGPLIPPSIVMVIFASLSQTSVGALLLGGVLPFILLSVMCFALVTLLAWKRGYPRGPKTSAKLILRTTHHGLLALLMPVIIVGGMFGGLYTATEGAAAAVIYVALVGSIVYKLNWKKARKALLETVSITGIVLFLYAATSAVAYILTISGLIRVMQNGFTDISQAGPLLAWVVGLLLLLILGLPLESAPLLVLTVPVIFGPLVALGYDPLVVGIVMVLVATMGAITPPVGINMFIAMKFAGATTMQFTKAILPFFGVLLIGIVAIIVFQPLVTWLPGLVIGGR